MANKRKETLPDKEQPIIGQTDESINIVHELVESFAKNIRHYKSKATKEAEIRQTFIDPFWRALGWTLGDATINPAETEVVVEKSIEVADTNGIRNRRPDYLFRLGGFPRFIVEAKKPAVDLNTDKNAIFQAKQYAWNSTIPLAVLTDFEQFRLFDTTLMPVLHEPERGLIAEFKLDYEQYESQWDTLTQTFGRDAVAAGSLEKLLAKVKKQSPRKRVRGVDRMLFDLKGNEPVDQIFLEYLAKHRDHFARSIYRQNKKLFPEASTLHGAAKLTEAVQRIMDRMVFMRVIEDREIVNYGEMREMLDRIGSEGGDYYQALIAAFRDCDRKYNGYLFKPHFSEELDIDGEVLADFTRTLYPPDGPWDFAAIGDDILGIVYERFLGNVVTVKRGQALIEEKPEVRHAGGVYYTPRFVVDSIIRRVIGPKLEGKTPAQVLDVKILDPACGSGSFLVAALQYLFDYCLAAIHDDPKLARAHIPAFNESKGKKGRRKKSDIAFQDQDGQWFLAPDFRAALLTHCIHGVDIDQQAVEVTVMSLYLKMLESKLPDNWATLWVERQLLPSLDNNIRCGNSLIDPESYDDYLTFAKKGALFGEDEDTQFRINRFDWYSRTHGFGRVIGDKPGKGGFDCIIGNPPYIRVQELKKFAPEECEFYKWKYQSAHKGNYDIYVVFTEKALNLLADDGLLGFIMPHKWWQAKYGEGLRKIVGEGKHLHSIIDFRQEQVFRSATTYTAIHVLGKIANPSTVEYGAIDMLVDGISQIAAIEARIPIDGIEIAETPHPATGNWSFVDAKSYLPSIITCKGIQPLCELARLAQGIKTSADKVYVLDIIHTTESIATCQSSQTGTYCDIERGVLLPLIKSEHMKRFAITASNKALLFPYQRNGDRFMAIPTERWRKEFPLAWNYLKKVKNVLQGRESGRMKDRDDWYTYIYPKNFDALSKPKLVIPDISEHMQIAMDSEGDFIFSGGAAGGNAIIPNNIEHMDYMCGLLNSQLLELYLRQTGTKFRGGYLNCEIRFIRNLPIKIPQNTAEKKLAKNIEQWVRSIIDAKAALSAPKLSDGERRRLETAIEADEHRIDQAVLQLYGIDRLPE